MLKGEKVTLRRVENADLWQLWHWHEMEELYLFSRIDPYISYSKVQDKFDDYFYRMMDFLIERDGKPIGICSSHNIVWKNRSCEITCKIYRDISNQSLMLDAFSTLLLFLFEEMNIMRVDSFVPEYEETLIRAMESTGFRLGGRLREHIFRNGAYSDLLALTVLKGSFTSNTIK